MVSFQCLVSSPLHRLVRAGRYSVPAFILAGLCVALLASCGDDDSARCSEATSIAYSDLASGDEPALCEHQHLVATLGSLQSDTGAPASFDVSLRILTTEPRQYCATDDDGEAHVISLRDAQGAVVWSTRTGEACSELTLPAGAYRLNVDHADPSSEDPASDTIYTRLDNDTGAPRFTVSSNSCIGCALSGDLPALSEGSFGYRGNYTDTVFSTVRCPAAVGGAETQCWFDGIFDGATIGPLTVDGAKDSVKLRGSFKAVALNIRVRPTSRPQRSVSIMQGTYLFRSVDNMIADMNCGAGINEEVAVNRLALDTFILGNSGKFDGQASCPVTLYGSEWANLMVNFQNKGIRGFSGIDSLRHVDLSGSEFRGFGTLSSRVRDTSLEGANLSAVQLWDANLDSSNLNGARFDGATLVNSVIGSTSGMPWMAQRASFQNADLIDVTFARHGDLTGASFDGAKLNYSSFGDDANLAGAKFTGASIYNLTARNAHWTNASFAGATIDTLDLSFAWEAPGLKLPERVRALKAINADLQGIVATDTVFDTVNFGGTDLSDATFAGAQLSYARMEGTSLNRTNFQGANLVETQLTCAFGVSTIFASAQARGARLEDAHFYKPSVEQLDLSNAFAPRAYLCDASLSAVKLNGSTLDRAFIPTTERSVFEPGYRSATRCLKSTFSTDSGTNGQTVCPNGAPGPCATAAMWVSSVVPPSTCNSNDPTCAAQGFPMGANCRGPCDCMSRQCDDLTGRCLTFQ